MEKLREYEEASIPFLGALNIARHIRNRRNGWRSARFDMVPLYDRGGPISISPSADGPITTLARIELNERRGRPLDEGLDHPDQLNTPGAP
jgi:hypothetical protein